MKKLFSELIDKFPRLSKEVSIVAIGYACTIILALVGNRIFTEIVPPVILGTVALAQTIGMFFTIWSTGILLYVARFYSIYKSKNDLKSLFILFTQDAKRWSIVVLAVSIIFVLLGIAGFFKQWAFLFALVLLTAIPGSWYSILSAALNAARKRIPVAINQILFNGFRPFVGAAFALLLLKPESILFSYMVLSVLVFIFIKKYFSQYESSAYASVGSSSQVMPRELKDYRNHMIWLQSIILLQPICERWILNYFLLRQDVGIYVAGYSLSSMATQTIGAFFSMLICPIIFGRFIDNVNPALWERGIKAIILFCIFIAFGFAAINLVFYWQSNLIVGLMFGQKYYALKSFMWKMLLGQSMSQMAIVVFLLTGQALRETDKYILIKYISTIAYLGIGAIWTHKIGIQGMVNASLLGNIINFIFAGWFTFYLITNKRRNMESVNLYIHET